MIRPCKRRIIAGSPKVTYFKPQGIPLRCLQEVELKPDEFEAMRLYFMQGLDQSMAAHAMGISQPTFARIIQRACKKLVEALVCGKAIRLESD